jgi:hypothetical protein
MAVSSLSESVKSRIAGVLLFGDTKFTAEGGKIKGFPAEKVHTYCNGFGELKSVTPIDTICERYDYGMKANLTELILFFSHSIPQLALTGTGGHLSYASSYTPGAAWLKQQVDAAKGGKSRN